MLIVDVETTGLNPNKHSIVSVGALYFLTPENQFYEECRIWDGAEIDFNALQINGFSKKEIIDPNKKSLEEVIKQFIKWIQPFEDKTIAGENPAFDRDFLIISAEKYRLNLGLSYRTIDLHSICYTHQLARGLVPPRHMNRTNLNTDNILDYVGLSKRKGIHNALTDVKLEAEAFSRLIHGKNLLKEFEKYPIPSYLNCVS